MKPISFMNRSLFLIFGVSFGSWSPSGLPLSGIISIIRVYLIIVCFGDDLR